MKTLLRAIGTLVVVICLAAFVLFKLNEKGFISGSLSAWVTSITEHVMGIKDETKDFLEEEGITLPTARPAQTEAPVSEGPALTSPETQISPEPNAG